MFVFLFNHLLYFSSKGDPRRPYPLDIEMRSGLLGKLGEGSDTTPASAFAMDGTSMNTAAPLANGKTVDTMCY